MGALYDRMARDLRLKNLSEVTQSQYLRCCCNFVRYHMKSPAQLGESEVKEFLGHLQMKGAGPQTLKMYVAGLKFLYGVTLNRPGVVKRLPWPKVPRKEPDVLSGTEVDDAVTFRTWGEQTAELPPHEFLRRFLLHVLPDGFVKLRHYGLLAPGNVNTRLVIARKLLETAAPPSLSTPSAAPSPTGEVEGWRELLFRLTGIDLTRCPQCGGPISSRPLARAPPRDTS